MSKRMLTDFDHNARPRYPAPKHPSWMPPRTDPEDIGGYLRTCGSAPTKPDAISVPATRLLP